MTYLFDRRRAAVVALVTVLLGAAALVVGAGSAHAGTGPCDREDGSHTWANVGGLVFVGAQPYQEGNIPDEGSYTGTWICATPPGKAWAVEVLDNDADRLGAVVQVYECTSAQTDCHKPVDWTGAEVNPATTTNLPGDGNSTSAASAGIGTGTCVWVDGGTPNCPFGGVTLLGVTVNEADLVPVFTPDEPEPPCTGIDNTCVPLGGTVRLFQDTDNPTLSVTTGVTGEPIPVDADPDGTCVQVNATC